MAESESTIPLYVLPVVGRGAAEVVPGNKSTGAVRVRQWTPGGAKSEQAGQYYSALCRALCSAEAKQTILNHLSLWKELGSESAPKAAGAESEYAIVVEDDNTVQPLLLQSAAALVGGMRAQQVHVLQLREPLHAGVRAQTPLSGNPSAYVYPARLHASLGAYIIHKPSAGRLHAEFLRSRVTAGLPLELPRVERAQGLTRMVLAGSSEYVTHEYRLRNELRGREYGASLRARAGAWLARNYPQAYAAATTPVFSLFGRVDVNVFGVLSVLFVLVLVVFDVQSRLAWLLVGALASGLLQ